VSERLVILINAHHIDNIFASISEAVVNYDYSKACKLVQHDISLTCEYQGPHSPVKCGLCALNCWEMQLRFSFTNHFVMWKPSEEILVLSYILFYTGQCTSLSLFHNFKGLRVTWDQQSLKNYGFIWNAIFFTCTHACRVLSKEE